MIRQASSLEFLPSRVGLSAKLDAAQPRRVALRFDRPPRRGRRGRKSFVLGYCAMSAREENVGGGEAGPQRGWLWRLIAGRVLVAALLFGVGALWSGGLAPGAQETHRLSVALPLAVLVVALSVLYALALRFSKLPLRAQAGAQFALDVLLITWLVWVTGNLYSPYSALYIVVISVASIFVGARGALLTSVGCAACYTATMLMLAVGLLGAHGRELTPASVEIGRA